MDWRGRELKICVYNRNFVNENFKMGNSIKGIFTLGRESIEQLWKSHILHRRLSGQGLRLM